MPSTNLITAYRDPLMLAGIWGHPHTILAVSAVDPVTGACGPNQAFAAGKATWGLIEYQRTAAEVLLGVIVTHNISSGTYAQAAVAWGFAQQAEDGSFPLGQTVGLPLSIGHTSSLFLAAVGDTLAAIVEDSYDPITGAFVGSPPSGSFYQLYKDKWVLGVQWWMAHVYPLYIASNSAYGKYGHRRALIAAILCNYALITGDSATYMAQLQVFIGQGGTVLAAAAPFPGLLANQFSGGWRQVAVAPIGGVPQPAVAIPPGGSAPGNAVGAPFAADGAAPENGGWDRNYGMVRDQYACTVVYRLPAGYPSHDATVTAIEASLLASANMELSRQDPTTGIVSPDGNTRDGVEDTESSGGTVVKTQDPYPINIALPATGLLLDSPPIYRGGVLAAFAKGWVAFTFAGTNVTEDDEVIPAPPARPGVIVLGAPVVRGGVQLGAAITRSTIVLGGPS